MPGPVSRTVMVAFSASDCSRTDALPPRGVNFSALPTRFVMSCTMRSRSKRISTGSAGTTESSATPRWTADSLKACTTAWIGSRMSPSRMSSGKMPASMRDRSRRFVLNHSSRLIWAMELSRNSVRVASSTSPSCWSSVYRRSAAIGVRSSWLTSATNSRSRSRSASSMRRVPARRSAMMLNCWPSSSISSTPDGSARSSS